MAGSTDFWKIFSKAFCAKFLAKGKTSADLENIKKKNWKSIAFSNFFLAVFPRFCSVL
jgi:hypothetical protein